MVQESYKISPTALAYYRDKNEMSQSDLADKANVSLRQYQRIEQKGQTTLQKANSIANALSIPVDELALSNIKSEWLVITPEGKREINTYCDQFFRDIQEKTNIGISSYDNELNIELHIDNDNPVYKTITVRFPFDNDDYVWKFYPVHFKPETGVVSGCKFTKVLEIIWGQSIKHLMANAGCTVFIDGKPLIPPYAKRYFCVDFFKFSSKTEDHEYQGYQLFENDYQLACSFNEWLNDGKGRDLNYSPTRAEEGKVIINYGRLSSLIVYRVWLDESGKKRQVPWTCYHRGLLIKSMSNLRFNDGAYTRVHVAPKAKNFQHSGDGYDIPPMTPIVSLS